MPLKAGIVGLPNVGKSSLFNILSSAKVQVANFPFCTIEPNVGVISVPDMRLSVLAELIKPNKVIPTTVEIVDIAGLVKGASKGEGLGSQFLSNIRNTDAIIHVLRCFDNDDILHVEGSVNPVRDKNIIDTELQIKDIENVEKKIEKIEKTNSRSKEEYLKVLSKVLAHLNDNKNVKDLKLNKDEESFILDLCLLTSKPVLYVCNVDDKSLVGGNKYTDQVKECIKNENSEIIFVSVAIENELSLIEDEEDRKMFIESLGLKENSIGRLINSTYKLLNLITYFTAGVKEVRAWTVKANSLAPTAAGVIHSDFEKGFIRAEVISYDDFIANKSEAICRQKGKLQIQGKNYVVQDGDIIHFRFNI